MRNTTVAISRVLALLAAFLTVSLVSGVLVAGLFLPAVGATGSLTRSGVDWFNSLKPVFNELPLAQGSTMYASDGKTVIARFYEENRVVTSLNRIAPVMRQAIVAIEDSRFYEHGGVDPKSLFRAAISNNSGGQVQGASTLTQQYIKNVLLENAYAKGDKAGQRAAIAKDNGRKINEIALAISLEKIRTKNEILEDYLNIANFGSNNYGVEAASQYFFHVTASKLTLPQAALLAGLVQLPQKYNPFEHPVAAKARRNTVLMRMRDLGIITVAQYTAALKTPLPTSPQPALSGCVTAGVYAYFCAYALKTLETDVRYKALGPDAETRDRAIKRGGLRIVTTLDASLQASATATLLKKIPATDPSHVLAAGVTVEPGSGKVLSIAQNRYYSNVAGPGRVETSFGVDQQYGGSPGFATGSSFKPFTLATWLANGKGLYDNVNGDLTDRPRSDFSACGKTLRGENYKFGNSEGGKVPSINVLAATYESVNTAFVDIESRLDMCDIAKTAQSIGVHLSSPGDPGCFTNGVSSTLLPTQCPSLTLGAFDISPMTMASAYAAFAADGIYCAPYAVISIRDRANKVVPFTPPTCSQALTPEVAHGVTYALKRVITQGTAAGISPVKWPAAGKTGTSDQSVRTWFVGYTKERSTAVVVTDPTTYRRGYLGIPGPRALKKTTIGGTFYPNEIFGATIAAPLWKSIMGAAMKGQPGGDWPDPPAKMLQGSGVKVVDVTGLPLDQASAILTGQGFKVTVGTPVPSSVGPGFVAKTSPSGGTSLDTGSQITISPGDGTQPPGRGPGNNNGPGNGRGNNNGGPITNAAAATG